MSKLGADSVGSDVTLSCSASSRTTSSGCAAYVAFGGTNFWTELSMAIGLDALLGI